ncbi:unnamed protein product [Cuscuta campestris]|uniref:DNA helicase n=1 Tax=Cuscuta campestris TaxID=132261 RepID=A0A484K0H7_9ASTE|nr:unnamed protein product [Cuscuta campestris]
MSSKGSKSKPDNETRSRRQKALEPPKEPPRPKTHWDHVLEEMVWLSKDFESERKWKLTQAKKVAIRASKCADQASRGEKRVKEGEQCLKKIALNIAKDVKKFWMKIEKLVLYKHQLELDEKKKRTLDKQLEFLLGQTERYSTMLAENLVSSPTQCKDINKSSCQEYLQRQCSEGTQDDENRRTQGNFGSQPVVPDIDDDYDLMSEDDLEDDEHTIEEDEALITREEREEELDALQKEMDLPIEELLKRYAEEQACRGNSPDKKDNLPDANNHQEDNAKGRDFAAPSDIKRNISSPTPGRGCAESNGVLSTLDNRFSELEPNKYINTRRKLQGSNTVHILDEIKDEQDGLDDDGDFVTAFEDSECYVDDETTLLEEEELAKAEPNNSANEIALLQMEGEIPIDELLARYKKDNEIDITCNDSESALSSASELSDSSMHKKSNQNLLEVESRDVKPTACPQTDEKEGDAVFNSDKEMDSENRLADAAAAARSAQPTGNTFSTTKVRTKFPFLLKYSLREYQHIGLDWLVTMYEKKLNGILADEMGLGKTIMTIALLAHLACEKGIWGPHLIVVPTSVMLNWETEFLKWCPAFKILTYFGSAKDRKMKRQGWLKPNSFHVCITTYRLVIQDSKVFKRKKWKYLILDEAHLIKNWKSQRWQTLLNFNSKRRILLTGTPLQNDLMELWSLMHFLMPHVFQSHQEFKDWFCNPISGIVEGQEKVNKEVVDRLHNVLRPFLLRRLKRDVEKQLPLKYEHVIYCRLSKRQRSLYEDFIASAETQATLASSNFFGMISVIMQLRKVCNHPDLFEGRPIVSSFDMNGIDVCLSSSICSMLMPGPFSAVDLIGLGFVFTHLDYSMTSWESDDIQAIATPPSMFDGLANLEETESRFNHERKLHGSSIFEEIQRELMLDRLNEVKDHAASLAWWNSLKSKRRPVYSTGLREIVTVKYPVYDIHNQKNNPFIYSSNLADIVLSPVSRFEQMVDQIESFMFTIPAARAPAPVCWCSKIGTSVFFHPTFKDRCSEVLSSLLTPFRPAIVRRQLYFPDRRLIQFDCGKLQELSFLLRRLKSEGHRALIFTQMTKMLDVLETFINLYGYTYMRLDGSTPPEERQTLMQRFNTNPKIFLFILSTRSGGVGINLVGADTVIFYDSDWNPAMDSQAQDRCHRIGQTREVHIYRLISESTIEENILKKANQKRALDDLVIQSGGYNTEFLKKLDPLELFSGHKTFPLKNSQNEKSSEAAEVPLSNADVEAALKNAEDEADYMALKKVEQEEDLDNQEFTEESIAKMEDDEFANEEEMKAEEHYTDDNKEKADVPNGSGPTEDHVISLLGKDEDSDVLDDVKQMAEAAAAAGGGQAILSFESQLRPIDRYAVRFLELWDPIIDKTAVELQDNFEETEWELDHIEKLKEDMEADMDDDDEPLVYEKWDADFATEAYRQHVETLAQIQLREELESKAREKELAEYENSIGNNVAASLKPKPKKKSKKTKFKSLKKGGLCSERKDMKEESPIEFMSTDDELMSEEVVSTPEIVSPRSVQPRKRKQASIGEESKQMKKSKKFKKTTEVSPLSIELSLLGMQQEESTELKHREKNLVEHEVKPFNKSKMGGKVSISLIPAKRIFILKPDKCKKKGTSKDYIPLADKWLPQEDAILCAAVHEYGPHWRLVSDILYGITGGGVYMGKFRHPVHCSERFRELIHRYVFSAPDVLNSDKANNFGSGKGFLKVTEENLQTLLDVAVELPDREPLIQRHFYSLLSSAWRSRRSDAHSHCSSQSGFRPLMFTSITNHSYSQNPTHAKLALTNLRQCSMLVRAALSNNPDGKTDSADAPSKSRTRDETHVPADERLDITLELHQAKIDRNISIPSLVHLEILGLDSPSSKLQAAEDIHLKCFQHSAQNRFRDALNACSEGSRDGPSLSFPTVEPKHKTPSRPQTAGKHKFSHSDPAKASKSKSKKIAVEHNDPCTSTTDQIFHPTDTLGNDFSAEIGSHYHDFENLSLLNTNEEELEAEFIDFVPHIYIPGLLSGLDDCSTFPEFTGIG